MSKSSKPISFPPIYGIDVAAHYPSVKISIEAITPDVAEKMLLTNIGNRDPKREAIEKAINNGEWMLNGATIVFDEDGNLTDGQNRLRACVNTGTTIDTLVVRGVPRAAQITMDTGVKRQLVDYLKMDGYKNCSTVGASGMGLCYLDMFGVEGAFSHQLSGIVTTKYAYEFIKANYDSRIEPLIKPLKAVTSRYKGLQCRTLATVFDVFRKAGEDNFNEFIEQLANRKPQCTSVRLLSQRLNQLADNSRGRPNQKFVAALIIKTWNAYMRGDDIKQLKYTQGGANPESFPEIFLGFDW